MQTVLILYANGIRKFFEFDGLHKMRMYLIFFQMNKCPLFSDCLMKFKYKNTPRYIKNLPDRI